MTHLSIVLHTWYSFDSTFWHGIVKVKWICIFLMVTLDRTQVNLLKVRLPYLFDYKPISAISRDPKLWTCRLGITRTKNKSKTRGYKPGPIHYYKTELLTMGKPNIFGKKSHCHKWGLDDNTRAYTRDAMVFYYAKSFPFRKHTRINKYYP